MGLPEDLENYVTEFLDIKESVNFALTCKDRSRDLRNLAVLYFEEKIDEVETIEDRISMRLQDGMNEADIDPFVGDMSTKTMLIFRTHFQLYQYITLQLPNKMAIIEDSDLANVSHDIFLCSCRIASYCLDTILEEEEDAEGEHAESNRK